MKNKNKIYAIGLVVVLFVVFYKICIPQTSEAMTRNFEPSLQLKLITEQNDIDGCVRFYREISTDVIYFELNDGVSIMLDPKTNLPLTYSNWKKMYKNK